MTNPNRCATLVSVCLVLLAGSLTSCRSALGLLETANAGGMTENDRAAIEGALGVIFHDSSSSSSPAVSLSRLPVETQNDNIRRYIVKAVDADGSAIRRQQQPDHTFEQKRQEAIEHLLAEALNQVAVRSKPVHRRTYLQPPPIQQKWPPAKFTNFNDYPRLGIEFSSDFSTSEPKSMNSNEAASVQHSSSSPALTTSDGLRGFSTNTLTNSDTSSAKYPAKSRKSGPTARLIQPRLNGSPTNPPTPYYSDPLSIAAASKKQATASGAMAPSFPRRMTNLANLSSPTSSASLLNSDNPLNQAIAAASTRPQSNLNRPTSNHHTHHRSGTEEVPLQPQNHSPISSDYEWKRVENTARWNNLRGMWGKRSISEPSSPDYRFKEFSDDQLNEARKILQQLYSSIDNENNNIKDRLRADGDAGRSSANLSERLAALGIQPTGASDYELAQALMDQNESEGQSIRAM